MCVMYGKTLNDKKKSYFSAKDMSSWMANVKAFTPYKQHSFTWNGNFRNLFGDFLNLQTCANYNIETEQPRNLYGKLIGSFNKSFISDDSHDIYLLCVYKVWDNYNFIKDSKVWLCFRSNTTFKMVVGFIVRVNIDIL